MRKVAGSNPAKCKFLVILKRTKCRSQMVFNTFDSKRCFRRLLSIARESVPEFREHFSRTLAELLWSKHSETLFTHRSSPEIRELARTKSVPNIIGGRERKRGRERQRERERGKSEREGESSIRTSIKKRQILYVHTNKLKDIYYHKIEIESMIYT